MNRRILCPTFVLLGGLALGPSAARSQCPAPEAPHITLFSNLPSARGQIYILAWSAPAGLDAGGTYLVERSPDGSFTAGVDSFGVSTISASLKSEATGIFFHRVRAIQSCGTSGPPSEAVQVTIVDGSPVVIFASQPPAVVRNAGDSSSTASFEVRNIGGTRFDGYLSPKGPPFFTLSDSGVIGLPPGGSKTFTVEFYGAFTNAAGTVQGLLTIESASGAQPKAYPWALVNLTVAPKPTVAERLSSLSGQPAPVFSTDFGSFQATATSADPPPITVSITNPRSTPLALAAETGPDGWLVPVSGWNATPLSPGETRQIRIESQRLRGETGGVYPRYAFLTVKTIDGQSARVQFQDLDDASGGPCASRAALSSSELSFVVPAVVSSEGTVGGRRVVFISKLLVSNIGIDPVDAEIFFTPDFGPGSPVDGYDCGAVRRAAVKIPGADVLSLTDPLSKLFGYSPADRISGTLEIRSQKIAQLRADSVVDSPAPAGGGAFGFQLPVVKRSTGAGRNVDHFLSGLVSTDKYRTNLILAETSGKGATVLYTVYAADNSVLARGTRAILPYAKFQVNDGDLFGGKNVPAASASLTVLEGEGAVIGLATVIDRLSQDASTLVSRPLTTAAARPAARRRTLGRAGYPYRFVVPSVVNGYNSKPGSGPYPYQSSLSITNGTLSPVAVLPTYLDQDGPHPGAVITVPARQTVLYQNVLTELFGVTASTTGLLLLDLDRPGAVLSSRVYSSTEDGSFGDSIPVYPADTGAATSGSDQRSLIVDGLETSVVDSRGARTNLILSEINGQAAEVEVRLFEKGKERSGPIGSARYTLAPFEKLQVNNVFSALGAGGKDRTNVLCHVTATKAAPGKVVSIATRIDNQTADFKTLVLLPMGQSQGESTIGF